MSFKLIRHFSLHAVRDMNGKQQEKSSGPKNLNAIGCLAREKVAIFVKAFFPAALRAHRFSFRDIAKLSGFMFALTEISFLFPICAAGGFFLVLAYFVAMPLNSATTRPLILRSHRVPNQFHSRLLLDNIIRKECTCSLFSVHYPARILLCGVSFCHSRVMFMSVIIECPCL